MKKDKDLMRTTSKEVSRNKSCFNTTFLNDEVGKPTKAVPVIMFLPALQC